MHRAGKVVLYFVSALQILCWCWSRVLVQFLKTSNLAERGHWHWGHQPQQPASHNLAPQLSAIYFKNKFVLKLLQIIRLVKYPVELTGHHINPKYETSSTR